MSDDKCTFPRCKKLMFYVFGFILITIVIIFTTYNAIIDDVNGALIYMLIMAEIMLFYFTLVIYGDCKRAFQIQESGELK